MKKFKDLVREFYDYPPTTPDEKNFLKTHTTNVVDYPVKNKDGLPFRDDSIKAPGPQHKKRATYEPPHEPTKVYKSANEEVENIDERVKKDDSDDIDQAVRDYKARGGTIKVGKARTAKGVTYMRNMSRQKGSSVAAKTAFREEVIAENADRHKAYPLTYDKGVWDHTHEVRHVNMDLTKSPDYKSEGPLKDSSGIKYPERLKKLVREHPLHKEMRAKGYSLHTYGEHKDSSFGKTYDTEGKVIKDAAKKKEKMNEAFEKMDTETLKARHKRFSDSLMKSPNATASSTDSHLDILDMHDELTKRGVRVEYPQHKLFDVERAAAKRKATKTKKVTQESLMNVDVDSGEMFESNDIMSLLAIISDTDNSAEVFFEGAEDSVVIDKELADMLLAAYAELDEEDQEDFEVTLTESEEDFGRCVDFAYNMLNE